MNRLDREIRIVARDFDAEYYAAEYPDIKLPPQQALEHFCSQGWQEGRNPSAYFDTMAYLLANGDVAEAQINPLYHYLSYGFTEDRNSIPAATPSVRTQLLFGYSIVDWVARVRPYIDEKYYQAFLPPGLSENIDLAAHFAYRGWQEGISPNREFEIRHWIRHYPDTKRFLVNPLLLRLEQERGAFQIGKRSIPLERPTQPAPEPLPAPIPNPVPLPDNVSAQIRGSLTDEQIALIQTEFSPAYYLAQNQDVAAAAIDPMKHYVMEGWKEGRNPNKEFDTSYYLAANEDVVIAGLNPFWHYLAEGRQEGRRPCRPGGHRRRTIDAARAPERRTDGYVLPTNEKFLTTAAAKSVRRTIARAPNGFVVSLSHDCYIQSVGGTQIFISDEQKKFNQAGYAYLHLSPRVPRLSMAPNGIEFDVRIVLNGLFLGVAPIASLFPLLSYKSDTESGQKILVVHSLLGFNRSIITELHAALQPQKSFYWLHDYSSICAGFNLLRNDVEFCNAPSTNSMACRVCICGPGRPLHLVETEEIFSQCRFNVLSPSQYTLDFWLAKSQLPHASARVHWHWLLTERPIAPDKRRHRITKQTITVAFVGFPLPSKGWNVFQTLVDHRLGDERYRFLHFVAPGTTSIPEVETIATEVTSSDRRATIALLRENATDIVLVLSTWPETFSFVAHEALVAGAAIICLTDSGNVAALVNRTGRGRVVENETELLALFDGNGVRALVHDLWNRNLPSLEIEEAGTTATALDTSSVTMRTNTL
jgi:hypothetical protein